MDSAYSAGAGFVSNKSGLATDQYEVGLVLWYGERFS